MPFQDGDKEFFQQLAFLYPVEYVRELEALAAEVLREQLRTGERQNIREIVYTIMEKIKNAADDSEIDKTTATAKQEAYLAAQAQATSEKVAALLSEGQAGFLAGLGPAAAAHLAAALNDKSADIATTAYEALLNLEDGGTIDAFCQLWEQTRRPELENILVRKGYLAARPLTLRTLTVLKTGAAPYMLTMNREALATIFAATGDGDRQIADRAEEMLLSLDSPDCIDVFCQMVLDNITNKKLLTLAAAGGHAPAAPPRAALFYCLTGQWEKYFALDRQPGHPLLQKGYAAASREEKEAFFTSAVREGHSRLAVEILLNCNKNQELLRITGVIWETIIENIANQQDKEFLAGLIWQTPPEISRKITLLLSQAGQEPPHEIPALCLPEGQDFFAPDGRELFALSLGGSGVKPGCLAFHPSEPLLAAGGADGAVKFWRLGENRPWRTIIMAEQGLCALAFAPGGRFLVTAATDGKVNIWNVPGLTWVASVKGHSGRALSIAINDAGHILAAVRDNPASPSIRLWYWDGTSVTNKALLPHSIFTIPAVHPSLRSALGVNASGQLRAWPQKTGQIFSSVRKAEPLALAITPCGSLAGTVADGYLNIWSVETGRLLAAIPAGKTCGYGFALNARGDLTALTDPENNVITVYQARWTKPLAAATHADLVYAAKMAESQNNGEINTYKYLAALLNAKFRKEG